MGSTGYAERVRRGGPIAAVLLGLVLAGCPPARDDDGDGFAADVDCADRDASRFPGAEEACNGLDDDCDDLVPDAELDRDGDGFRPCEADCNDFNADQIPVDGDLDGWSICAGDCDDDRALRNPGAVEVCNREDDDCDGSLPLEEQDIDADGVTPCEGDCDDFDPTEGPFDADEDGHTTCAGDCDDLDPDVHPDALEACDGVDQNCDGAPALQEYDLDGDGFAPCEGDCDDFDALVGPFDGDLDGFAGCDGDCDDTDPERAPVDDDGDGFDACGADCDLADATVYPGAPEVCDGVDQDCDGVVPANELDGDGDGWIACADCDDGDAAAGGLDADADGFSECDGDCDDGVAGVAPGVGDLYGDGLDLNCDGVDGLDADGDGFPGNAPPDAPDADCDDADANATPADGDGDGFTGCGAVCEEVCGPWWDEWDPPCTACVPDCDDADAAVAPDAEDICDDGIDSDCGDDLDEEIDDDGDGASECAGDCDDADPAMSPLVDADADGWSPCAGDCDESDPARHPGIWEDATDTLDEDCDGTSGTGLGFGAQVLAGPAASGYGLVLACGGDVDGDGRPDFAVAAPYWEPTGGLNRGAVYVYTGTSSVASGTTTSAAAAAAVVIIGEEDIDLVGSDIDLAGDLDGDGLSDLIVGARYNDQGGASAGAVGVFWGTTLAGGGTWAFSDADVMLLGEDGWHLGTAVAVMPDLDGDGADELVATAPGSAVTGRAYLWGGADLDSAGPVVEADEAATSFSSSAPAGTFGESMSVVGDVTGDGVSDVVVLAWLAPEVTLWSGAVLAGGGSLSVEAAHATFDGGFAGWHGAVGGSDVDGDGTADLVLHAPPGPTSAGGVLVFSGEDLEGGGAFAPGDAVVDLPGDPGDWAGRSLALLPDLDGDSRDEILIGAPGADTFPVGDGRVSVVLTGNLPGASHLDGAPYALVGAPGTEAGVSLCALEDVDGDGVGEVLVGGVGGPAPSAYLLPLP